MRDKYADTRLPFSGICDHCRFDSFFHGYQVNTAAAAVLAERSKLICKDYIRQISSAYLKLCYYSRTMSEINRGIPESVTQKATIINFEAAKGKRLEEKTKQAQWIQERTQKPQTNRVEADIPAFIQPHTEGTQQPIHEKRIESIIQAGESGENKHPATSPHTVIDFTQAREKRLLNQQSNSPVTAENANDIPSFLKPDSIDTGEKVVNDSVKTQENNPDDVDRNQEEDNPQNTIESDKITREKEQIKAMGLIGTKLAQFDVPMQKRDEIFENLADDPKAIVKVAGVIKNFHPQNSIEILENIADFRKRIDQAVENKAAQVNEEAEQELSGFELLLLILGSLLKGSVNAIAGDELEQIGLKEKEEKSA